MSTLASPTFPRPMLIGAATLIGATILAAALTSSGRHEGVPPSAPAVAARTLRFADRIDGAVTVTDMATGREIATVTGEQGFLRGMLRSFARERHQDGIGPRPPLVLTRYADGRVLLSDPETGRGIDLEAFGPTNLATFTQFLPQGAAR